MYEIWSSAGLIWHPCMNRDNRAVLSAKTALSLNTAGSLTFTLPPGHPAFDLLPKLASECWVLQDGEELFRGRVLYSDRNMRNCKDIFCEGLLNVLNDEHLRPGDLSLNGTYSGTASGLIDKLCAAYNARQTGAVPFARGTVDDFGTVKCESQDYPQIGAFLLQAVEDYGGYVRVRRVNGQNLIDWTVASESAEGQMIRFGENLLDLNEHITGEDIFTVVIPLGKDRGEGLGRLTIRDAALSGGVDYIGNPAAITALGVRIAKTVTFDEIEDPDELYAAGTSIFAHGGGLLTGIELTALDLYDIGVETDRLRVGNYYHVYSPPHSINVNMPLTKAEIDLLHPDAAMFFFGVSMTSLTERQTQTVRAASVTATAALNKANAAATPAQVNAAIAASEARTYDYVTEISVVDGWFVRTWASGLKECRCVVSVMIPANGMTAWGGIYYITATKAYPPGLFASTPMLHAAVISGSIGAWCGMASPSSHTQYTAAFSVISPEPVTTDQVCAVTLCAWAREEDPDA